MGMIKWTICLIGFTKVSLLAFCGCLVVTCIYLLQHLLNTRKVVNNMGTNYYADFSIGHTGVTETLHIGKKSFGWCFLFHGIIDRAESYDQWLTLLETATRIYDEYDKDVTLDDLAAVMNNSNNEKNFKPNDSEMRAWQDSRGFPFSAREFS